MYVCGEKHIAPMQELNVEAIAEGIEIERHHNLLKSLVVSTVKATSILGPTLSA